MDKTLYIDLDGTCFEFRKDATLDEILEKGFFSSLFPFDNVIKGLKIFQDKHPEIKLKILSSCLDREYIKDDKNCLVDKHIPFIGKEDRIYVPYGEKKSDYMLASNKSHISYLLDDYSKNLEEINSKNMKGIKLINNINSTKGSWKGDSIYFDYPDWLIADELERIIVKKGG